MRDFHGKRDEIRGIKPMILNGERFGYQTYGLGNFVQGLNAENLERLLQVHLQIVSVFLMFSSILLGLFPSILCIVAYNFQS
jgi:hypothetical protein